MAPIRGLEVSHLWKGCWERLSRRGWYANQGSWVGHCFGSGNAGQNRLANAAAITICCLNLTRENAILWHHSATQVDKVLEPMPAALFWFNLKGRAVCRGDEE
jgi:hypothetical protein